MSSSARRPKRHGGYVIVHVPGHPRANSQGYVFEHVLVAEAVLGKYLPPKAVVHHIDLEKTNNHPSNLVVCPDQAYHRLLHHRIRAREAGYPAHYRRCYVCRSWDAAEALVLRPRKAAVHRACEQERDRIRKREAYRRSHGREGV